MLKILLTTAAIACWDGDTIGVNGVTYRLVGFNTAEKGGTAKCTAEGRLAQFQRRALCTLIKDPTAELTETKCVGYNYGRRCGVVRVRGEDIAPTMIKEFYADPYQCDPVKQTCPQRRNWCTK